MNNQLTKLKSVKREEGFTIIEVLIVLAIGALIILAVLLAVPALQTNQKNSQRKSEASRIAAGVTQFLADQGDIASSTASTDIAKRAGTLTILTAPTVGSTPVAADISTAAVSTQSKVFYKTTCLGTTASIVAGTNTNSNIVVWYPLEGTGASACITVR